MRVTNSMLVSNFMNNLNTNMTKLSALQEQMASGRKYTHISDDPVAVIYSQQARYKLERLSHYSSNVEIAQDWLTQAEAGTMELNSVLASAYETCIDAATDVKNGGDLTNIAQYLAQLREQILQSLNTTFGDKYVFGGYNTTGYVENGQVVPPFTVNELGNLCYNGVDLNIEQTIAKLETKNQDNQALIDELTAGLPDTQDQIDELNAEIQDNQDLIDDLNAKLPDAKALIADLRKDVMTFDLAMGTEMPVTVNGIDLVFYGTDPDTGANLNIFNLISDLYDTVNNGGPAEEINNYISDLQAAQNHVLGITANIGGRVNRLEILSSRYAQDEINYTQMLSDAEDADFAEVIMNFKMAEAVYNAALAAGASIIQPTLMDFLG